MNLHGKRLWIPGLLLLVLAGCVTINLYFPESEVKDLAQRIEEQVQQKAESETASGEGETPEGEPAPPEESKPGAGASESPAGGSISLLESFLGVSVAHAQGVPEPEVSNPAIRKIIESRAGRLADVNRYKTAGAIGENNKGMLEIRDLDSLSDLRARAEAQKLVRAENNDREQLYKEIAAVKNIDESQLQRIGETYAETMRQNARSGDWIQLEDGTWKRKN